MLVRDGFAIIGFVCDTCHVESMGGAMFVNVGLAYGQKDFCSQTCYEQFEHYPRVVIEAEV